MDRRAAGALLALAACIACSAAAPTASNQTALDLYEGAPEGCYYNFQHYGEGDRIMTNEPCLNCTCHNRMLMCYLRVCPFTKAIGQDCTVEKRADQCCPIVTCPDVPVDLLTSTSTTSPAEYGATGLGKLDKYGCSISGKYFPEGSKVPPTPNKPCEHCYCIRNMTTCVMQECTLHVDGCTPIYHKDVCCPVRYSCDHPEDEVPLLDDMSTTIRPTPGFLLTTTTISPVTQMSQDCVHDDQIFSDGALIKTEKACEHCYCMKGDIVCVVQECGAPMENEGKNCTSLPPREGQCCPDTYICEGDELSSELPTDSTTELDIEKLTTLSPPRRTSVEGSGYRNEPDETAYTEIPTDFEVEGSGEDQEPSKPLQPDEMIPPSEDGDQYIYVTTKAPSEEHELTTTAISKDTIPEIADKTVDPGVYLSTTIAPGHEDVEKFTTSAVTGEEMLLLHEHVSTTGAPESYEKVTTELGEALNTVPDVIPEEEIIKPHVTSTTSAPESYESQAPNESEDVKPTSLDKEVDRTTSVPSEINEPESSTPTSSSLDKNKESTPEILNVTPEIVTEKEYSESDIKTTSATPIEETESPITEQGEIEKEVTKSEEFATSSQPVEEELTTEPDHAQNTIAVAEEETSYPHSHIRTTTAALPSGGEESSTKLNLEQNIVTEKETLEQHEHISTAAPTLKENEGTTEEPDRRMNTVPSEISEESSSEPTLLDITTLSTKETEPSVITDEKETQSVDIKPTTVSEIATQVPDSITTKVDQYTITTEPSFRKEDESIVSTAKPKDFEKTTVRPEFVDEGLIPTSAHDEKMSTSSDVPSTDEEFTTLIPEYNKELEETTESKLTTTESTLETSAITASEPEKVPESSSEKEGALSSSTEKSTEVTTLDQENEEPSRIPGEGDCLLNGLTYRNNSVVPSTNNCHTGCRCASSIIKCDPIICSPPPDYMNNCQSIYDSPESCCPTYICDHPRETVPPQSDNQMSGTESPMLPPTIECRGDQCELSEPTKLPTVPSEPCTSSSCLSGADHKSGTECGPGGCGDILHKPDTSSSVDKTEECVDGKCYPENCPNGECQLPQTEGQVFPIKPCEGDHCDESSEVTPELPQPCTNEEECKTLEVPTIQAKPCKGESCNKIDCGSGGCDPNIISQQDHQIASCKEEDGCKPLPVPECTGEEPCRRKETSASDEKLPSACDGTDCKNELETVDKNIAQSTESLTTDQTDKATDSPISHITKLDDVNIPGKDEQKLDMYTTEAASGDDILKEKTSVTERIATETPNIPVESETLASVDDGDKRKPVGESVITEKPITIEREGTEIPDTDKQGTVEPSLIGEDGHLKPSKVTDKDTDTPTMIGEKGEEEPAVIDEGYTVEPVTINKDDTEEKPITPEEEGIKETTATENVATTVPAFSEKETSDKPASSEEKGTVVPALIEQGSTHMPETIEDTEKPTEIYEEDKEKPFTIAEADMKKPVEEDGTDNTEKPDLAGAEKPSFEGEESSKPDDTKEESTTKPVQISDEEKEKPADGIEVTKKPSLTEEKETELPILVEEEAAKQPTMIDGKGTEKPTSVDNESKSTVFEQESTEKYTYNYEKVTEKPVIDDGKKEPNLVENESTEKTVIIDETETEKSPEIDEEHKEKPTVIEGNTETSLIEEEKVSESTAMPISESTEEPNVVAKETDKPTMIGDDVEEAVATTEPEDTMKPVTIEREGTELPVVIGEELTEKPAVSDEVKEKPVIDEEKIETSEIDKEAVTIKPLLTEDEKQALPESTEDKGTDKPEIDEGATQKPIISNEDTTVSINIEREGTEVPSMIGEDDTEKPALIDKDAGDTPILVEHDSTKTPSIAEEGTEKPMITGEEDLIKPAIENSSDKVDITEEGTEEPAVIEKEGTDIPPIGEDQTTQKPAMDYDEGKMKPEDGEDIEKPVPVEKEGQEKPVMVMDKKTEKPAVIEEEVKEKPTDTEVESTEEPKLPEREGSGTEIPEEYTVEPEKEIKSPDFVEKPTEAAGIEIETETKSPISKFQTTTTEDVEHSYNTESNFVEPIEGVTTPQEITSETPEIKLPNTESGEVPAILDNTRRTTPDVATEALKEQETTTKSFLPEQEKETITELNVQSTTSKIETTYISEESSTLGQEMAVDEVTLSSQSPELPDITESKDSTTETASIGEQEEVFTETSDLESPTTKSPGIGPVIIEPQEGVTEKPEISGTSPAEESITKVYENEKLKPEPESHVTEPTKDSHDHSENVDRATEVPKITDKDKQDAEIPESHGAEADITTKQPTVDEAKEEIKTEKPELYSPEKEEMLTEAPGYPVTEPVRRFTEIEDPSVTGQAEITTSYPDESTEQREPSVTDKIEAIPITSSEKPFITDIESPKLPEERPEIGKPVTELPEESETEKEQPNDDKLPATNIPVVTESQESVHIPEKAVSSYEEKTTSFPDSLSHTHKDSTPAEGYTEQQELSTEIPQHPVTVFKEQSEATEAFITEQTITDAEETSTKIVDHKITDFQAITTELPRTSEKEAETETKSPEPIVTEKIEDLDKEEPSITEIQKLPTELPTPVEDVHTESPGLQMTSEVPQSLVTEHVETIIAETTVSSIPKDESSYKPDLPSQTTLSEEISKTPEIHVSGKDEIVTETPVHVTEPIKEIIYQEDKITSTSEDIVTEKQETATTLRESTVIPQEVEPIDVIKSTEHTSAQTELSETTPYLIELEEHTHKTVKESTTVSPLEEHTYTPAEDTSVSSPSEDESSHKMEENIPTVSPFVEKSTTVHPEAGQDQISELTTKIIDEEIETATKEVDASSKPSEESLPEDVSEKITEMVPIEETTPTAAVSEDNKYATDHKEYITSTPSVVTESEKVTVSESDVTVQTEKETYASEKPLHPIVSHETTSPEEEFIFSTTKPTTIRHEEDITTPVSDDKLAKPGEKPSETNEIPPSSTTAEVSKPSVSDMQPTDEIPAPDEEGHFPPSGTSGYGEPDYVEEDQAFGPGTCRYGGKVYVSAQQIPRDDPCDFCFCFRSDIICLQQSCPPPIHGCHEEPIQGFCCPRYECPVSMATTVNVTTTTTTTTTTLPPHFPTHSYKGAAQRRGCQIKGHTYKVGEVVRSSSGPCLHCTCGGDGQMKCDPKACTPEPMLRQMIAAAVSAKRRR